MRSFFTSTQCPDFGAIPSQQEKQKLALYHLKQRKSLTAIELNQLVKTTDAHGIMHRLAKQGKVKRVTEKNANNNGTHTRYYYVEE